PLAGNRDRDRRPCEGFPNASATRPVASARTASRVSRDAVVSLEVFSGTGTFACANFSTAESSWMRETGENRTAKLGCATQASNGAAHCPIRIAQCTGSDPERLCYDFSQSWPLRGVRFRVPRGQAQHPDDGRRSIHTFL